MTAQLLFFGISLGVFGVSAAVLFVLFMRQDWNMKEMEGGASIGKRFINWFLDTMFSVGIGKLGCILYAIALRNLNLHPDRITLFFVFTTIYTVLNVSYYFVFEKYFQKTPAKFLTRTKVIGLNGNHPTDEQILLRTFCRLMPLETLSCRFAPLSSWWHDRWSATLVVEDTAIIQTNTVITASFKQQKLLAYLALFIFISLGTLFFFFPFSKVLGIHN